MPKYNIFKCINSSISCLYSLDWKEDDDRPLLHILNFDFNEIAEGVIWNHISISPPFHRYTATAVFHTCLFSQAPWSGFSILNEILHQNHKTMAKFTCPVHKILDRYWGVSQYKISKKVQFWGIYTSYHKSHCLSQMLKSN